MGDSYECYADAVADEVVQGESAENLLTENMFNFSSHSNIQSFSAALQFVNLHNIGIGIDAAVGGSAMGAIYGRPEKFSNKEPENLEREQAIFARELRDTSGTKFETYRVTYDVLSAGRGIKPGAAAENDEAALSREVFEGKLQVARERGDRDGIEAYQGMLDELPGSGGIDFDGAENTVWLDFKSGHYRPSFSSWGVAAPVWRTANYSPVKWPDSPWV
ncbi:MAG: hypothetical protein JKY13_00705 [Gammaproteobacteria bacterium]|nr:hypothetical protein [Gammaproteobacteria bacterium]